MASKRRAARSSSKVVASGPTAAVPKDPQPSVDRLDELARRVRMGDVLLPRFQRGFVWTRQQVLDLLDSIARNYPIGSILLWQSRQELRSENRIADLQIELPKPDYPVNYLLDGQQRLSAICGALYWDGQSAQSVWNIAYDLRDNEFIYLDTLDDPPQHQVRMNKLSDASAFYKHVASLDTLAAPDKEELKRSADALFNRFKDYKIATVTLGDMAIEDVAPIFERINSTATQLTIVDLMRAATWSQDFDLIEAIDAVRDTLSEKGFGGLDRKAVLRTMSAAAGGGFSVTSINALRRRAADVLQEAARESGEAYKRTADYLSTQIGAPSDAVIPYVNQVVVLAEVFRVLPSPAAAQYASITKWFWRTASAGYFSGWNTGMMASDKEAVRKFGAGEAPEIAVNASKPRTDIWLARTFRSNGAHAKTLAILLSYHQPIDLLTGQKVDVGKALAWTNAKEFHHFFPREFLKQNDTPSSGANCLANIVMLSSDSNKKIGGQAPSVYLKQVTEAAGDDLKAWLASHLITMEAYDAAVNDDFDSFRELRAASIQERACELAAWE